MVKKKKTLKRKAKKTLKRSRTTDLGSAMIKQMLGGQGGSGGINLQGMMSGMSGGPGTHAPVKASGAAVGKMADGRMIHLTGPKMGQMV